MYSYVLGSIAGKRSLAEKDTQYVFWKGRSCGKPKIRTMVPLRRAERPTNESRVL